MGPGCVRVGPRAEREARRTGLVAGRWVRRLGALPGPCVLCDVSSSGVRFSVGGGVRDIIDLAAATIVV